MPTSLESSTHSGDAARPLGGLDDLRPAFLGDATLAELLALDHAPARRRSAARARPRTSRARTARPACRARSAAFSAMLRDQAALAHRRARGDHDQVPRLKPAGHLVEVLEAGRRAGQRGLRDRQLVQLVELLVQQRVDRAEVLLAVVVGDLEHRLLGLLDELARRRRAGRARCPGSRRSRASSRRSSAFSRTICA